MFVSKKVIVIGFSNHFWIIQLLYSSNLNCSTTIYGWLWLYILMVRQPWWICKCYCGLWWSRSKISSLLVSSHYEASSSCTSCTPQQTHQWNPTNDRHEISAHIARGVPVPLLRAFLWGDTPSSCHRTCHPTFRGALSRVWTGGEECLQRLSAKRWQGGSEDSARAYRWCFRRFIL